MNSLEYWRKREDEQTRLYQKDEKQVEREIEEIYQNTLDNVEKEIYSFYAKYASKEGITINEAKKRVTKADIAEYEKKAEKYVKLASQDRVKGTDANAHIYFSDKANEEMALYNLTMKVNRLEMLKSKIGLELAKGNAEAEAKMQKQLEKRSMEEMKRQAGILGKTLVNQDKKANAIVNGSFHNATFSDRIWANMDMLKAKIDTLLQQGMIQGKGARQLAVNIRKEFNVTTFQSERLMRTELARIQIETQKESYMRNGFEEYEFIANSGCCDACQALNGKVFKVKKMMPGENAAPIHPNCRCSTAPYEDSKEYEEWLDFLDKGGTTEEWNKLSIEDRKNGVKIKEKKQHSELYKEIVDVIEQKNIKYNEVKKFNEQISMSEKIKRLAGGDMTAGSCSSLAFAYIGNKHGFNVIDFRGGNSQKIFSNTTIIEKISKLPNVKTQVTKVQKEATGANELINNLPKGKEYYFCSGRHAAIVRNTDNGPEYLELQSKIENGWTSFDKYGSSYMTLVKRFGCRKSVDKVKVGSQTLIFEKDIILMDVDSFKDNYDFEKILGYINTNEEKQKKGSGGSVK